MNSELIKRFLIKWVLYTSLGWLLAQVVGVFITRAAFPQAELTALPTSPVYFAVFGFILGLSQWLCIRDYLPIPFGWVVATATGCFAAALTLKLFNQMEMINAFLREFRFLGHFLGGIILGSAQYITIKKVFRESYWWIIFVAVMWTITQAFLGVDNAVVDLLGIFVFATSTGLTLVWLVRNPFSEIQTA